MAFLHHNHTQTYSPKSIENGEHGTKKCYQLLIAENARLQLEVKKRIPEEDVIFFMSKLRDLIIKLQTNKYDSNDKLKDISKLYLKYINKLGGIKYESND